jgi:hypothetical protein
LLDRIVAMLTKLGQRGYTVHEDQVPYAVGIDPDSDSDSDPDRRTPQRTGQQVSAPDSLVPREPVRMNVGCRRGKAGRKPKACRWVAGGKRSATPGLG